MSLSAGARLGGYEVLSLLGKGGMGEVWLARDTRLEREVAIKVLPELFSADPERRLRFEREAKILASLNHPHIAAIHGLEEVGGQRFLVLEYVPGVTLDERLADGPLGVEDSLRICRQIAAALEDAHGRGVVHRDLKPGNVMVLPDEAVKVLDFGLARVGAAESGSSAPADSPTITEDHTALGVVLGTAPYMSPEQARGRAVDKRSDIWSFGVILFECLSGTRLFRGESASDSMGAVLHKELEWSALPGDTPPIVQLLLRRCLTRDRKQRLQDIGDARIELEHAIADPSGASLGLASAAASPELACRGVGFWLPWGLVLVLAVVAAAALWRNSPPETPPKTSPAAPPRPIHLALNLPETDGKPVDRLQLAVSADGRTVVTRPRLDFPLHFRTLEDPKAHPIPGTEWTVSTRISPDGRSIVFQQFTNGQNAIWRAQLDGTPPARLASVPSTALDWLDTSELILLDRDQECFARMKVRDGSVTLLPETRAACAEILGDRRSLLLEVRRVPGRTDRVILADRSSSNSGSGAGNLWIVSLEDGRFWRLVSNGTDARATSAGELFFLRDRVLMGVEVDFDTMSLRGDVTSRLEDEVDHYDLGAEGHLVYLPAGTPASSRPRQLFTRAAGGPAEPLGAPLRTYVHACWSPDGTRVLSLTAEESSTGFWIWDPATGGDHPIARLSSYSSNSTYLWSPDSQRVAYLQRALRETNSPDSLHILAADGSGATQDPIGLPSGRQVYDWVEDSRMIASTESGDGLCLWSLDTGETRELVSGFGNALAARLCPKRRWLAYSAMLGSEYRVFLQTMGEELRPIGPRHVLPGVDHRVTQLEWSSDGSRLYLEGAGGTSVWAFDLAADGSGLAKSPEGSGSSRIEPVIFDLREGLEEGVSLAWKGGIGPDDRILFAAGTEPDPPVDQLQVILNWTAGFEIAKEPPR
jgi:serine/threonine protein kinase/Tol biopolymer transport system component